MLPIASENMFFELICFTAFISICAGLLKLRYSKKCSFLILAAVSLWLPVYKSRYF